MNFKLKYFRPVLVLALVVITAFHASSAWAQGGGRGASGRQSRP